MTTQHPNPTLIRNIPKSVFKLSMKIAQTGNFLLWVGESIVLLSKDNQRIELFAAEIKLIAGGLLIIASVVEGQEAKLYSGILPKETPPKIIGSAISEIGAIILTAVLYYQISRAKTPSAKGEPLTPPFLGEIS